MPSKSICAERSFYKIFYFVLFLSFFPVVVVVVVDPFSLFFFD
jgi:hypothetical protein